MKLLSLVALTVVCEGCSENSAEKKLSSVERRYDQVTVAAEAYGTRSNFGNRTGALIWHVENRSDEILCVPSFYESGQSPIQHTVTLTSKNGRTGTVGSYLYFPSDPWDDYILVLPNENRRITLQLPDLDRAVGPARELSYNFSFFFCQDLGPDGFPSYNELIAGDWSSSPDRKLPERKFVLHGKLDLDF